MEHNGQFLTDAVYGTQWVTANKGMAKKPTLCTVPGTDGSTTKMP